MTEYIEDLALTEIANDLYTDVSVHEFGGLRKAEIKLSAYLKVKMTKDHELKRCGKPFDVKKISLFEKLFTKFDYVILVDKYIWDDLDTTKKSALIHKALMSIHIETKPDGSLKLAKKSPDIQEFTETVARFGAYSDEITVLSDVLRNGTSEAVKHILEKSSI